MSNNTESLTVSHCDFDGDCLHHESKLQIEEGGKLSKRTMEALKSQNDDEANTRSLFSDEEWDKRFCVCTFTSTWLPMSHRCNSENTTL